MDIPKVGHTPRRYAYIQLLDANITLTTVIAFFLKDSDIRTSILGPRTIYVDSKADLKAFKSSGIKSIAFVYCKSAILKIRDTIKFGLAQVPTNEAVKPHISYYSSCFKKNLIEEASKRWLQFIE